MSTTGLVPIATNPETAESSTGLKKPKSAMTIFLAMNPPKPTSPPNLSDPIRKTPVTFQLVTRCTSHSITGYRYCSTVPPLQV